MATDLIAEKRIAAEAAVAMVKDAQVVGLGTGSTAEFAVKAIAERVKQGLQIKGIPTSDNTAQMARQLGIPLIDINSIDTIDITIDGADEFTEQLHLIKGGGGALLKEKIVASKTTQQIIIADSSKHVAFLGKFKLPVEVIPFASRYVMAQLAKLGGDGVVRQVNGQPFITDEGNVIIDADFKKISDPVALSDALNGIVGVVEHGLFTGLAQQVIMGHEGGVKIFR
ncbi:ribose-5-phosphate isomerase RpiA [Chitinophaga horti]|uniref:Ribose-5-phosphate isomerase A n=1 Tax=Chitinophaga horti TaxID=2920382 RepID=A0ABY6IXW5_9BACT|nr:ribose-5-phosphate isomerase RpiA [Chitinophaga horti]UYQ91252.1 ribose-5-phosphate isomerase RpiA [Chitinophaga horti]